MIIIELIGGLGNQLFQLSAAYSLAIDRNEELLISNIPRNFYSSRPSYFDSYFKHLKIIVIENPNIDDYFLYEDPNPLLFHEIPNFKNIYLKGFFQNFKYIKHNKNAIKNFLGINNYQTVERCAIHFRMGDFRNAPAFPILNDDYYIKCINKINSKNWLIFCEINEKNNVEQRIKKFNLQGDINFYHSDPFDEIKEMSKSKYIIIANSSFSLYASFLSNDECKIFYPDIWFTNQSISIDDQRYEIVEAKNMK